MKSLKKRLSLRLRKKRINYSQTNLNRKKLTQGKLPPVDPMPSKRSLPAWKKTLQPKRGGRFR